MHQQQSKHEILVFLDRETYTRRYSVWEMSNKIHQSVILCTSRLASLKLSQSLKDLVQRI